MRIAFNVPRAHYLEPGSSGDKIFVPSLMGGLEKRGHEVKIVSRMDVRDFWKGRIPPRCLLNEAIAVRQEMKRFSPEAWLVYGSHLSSPDLFGWWQCPKRYVLFAASYATWDAQRLPRWWRRLFTFAFRQSLRRADRITTWRADIADHLRSGGVRGERLCVLSPAVQMWAEVPSREESRHRLGLPQETPVVLCISRFTVNNGRGDPRPGKTEMILPLLAALPSLPSDAVLVLVGDGHGRHRLQEETARLQLQRRVRFAGAVEHDKLKWFYAACDFYAFPDLLDLPRLAILEAQACGRPVVTMHTPSAERTVCAGRTGLLARNLEEFQAHLAALAQDRSRCVAMGEAGQEYITQFHAIQVRARQIEELLLG